MDTTLLEYKCPSCGGALSFDSGTQNMKCPYCDSELDVAALKQLDEALNQPQQDQMEWQSPEGSHWSEEEQGSFTQFVCKSCGGEIICQDTTAAAHCPYCDNPVVMVGRLSGILRPDLVIPFKQDKEAAKNALKKHLTGKRLLPKVFKDENRIEAIQGIYVPFWLYDATANADLHYRATRTHVWSDSRYIYTQTSHYAIHRAGTIGFTGVPADGSRKMEDALMESIEPYDLSQAVDFQTAYLAGYLADKYDVTAEENTPRINQRIRNTTENTFRSTVMDYQTCVPAGGSVRLTENVIRYALLPVWILTTKYKGEKYTFAMNGQTGKFVGNLPLDWGKFWGWFTGVSLTVGGLCFGLGKLLGIL